MLKFEEESRRYSNKIEEMRRIKKTPNFSKSKKYRFFMKS